MIVSLHESMIWACFCLCLSLLYCFLSAEMSTVSRSRSTFCRGVIMAKYALLSQVNMTPSLMTSMASSSGQKKQKFGRKAKTK